MFSQVTLKTGKHDHKVFYAKATWLDSQLDLWFITSSTWNLCTWNGLVHLGALYVSPALTLARRTKEQTWDDTSLSRHLSWVWQSLPRLTCKHIKSVRLKPKGNETHTPPRKKEVHIQKERKIQATNKLLLSIYLNKSQSTFHSSAN